MCANQYVVGYKFSLYLSHFALVTLPQIKRHRHNRWTYINFPATKNLQKPSTYATKIHDVKNVGDIQLLHWLAPMRQVLTKIHITRVCNVDSGLQLEGSVSYTNGSPEARQDPMLSIKISSNTHHCWTTMEQVPTCSYTVVSGTEIQQIRLKGKNLYRNQQ